MTVIQIEIQDFDEFPPDEVRRVWCEWLRHHGVDPSHVAIPGRIGRFVCERQVRYLSWCLARTPEDCTHEHIGPDAEEFPRVLRIVQLESEPSQFPPTSHLT